MRTLYVLPLIAFATAHSARSAPYIAVGTCLPNATSLPTITQAITAAASNAIIKICPGTYAEQLTITKNVTLEGVASGNASQVLIVPPSGGLVNNAPDLDTAQPTAAQIAVQGATVSLSNLVVDGTGNGIGAYGCAWDVVGILYQNGSGTVSGNLVRNEFAAPFASYGGCQSGQGIFVQTSTGNASTVVITKNIVETYAKNGITGNDTGTNVTISNNIVIGNGPTTAAAENSVQIAFGATGSVTSNVVGADVWQPDQFGDTGDAAAGILVYASPGALISGNSVNGTQYGIAVSGDGNGDGDGAKITGNRVGVTYLYDAIDVCGAGKATITGNSLTGSDESGIHLDSSCGSASTGNTVNSNTIVGGCAGILEGTGSGGTIGTNKVSDAVNQTLTGSDTCVAAGASSTAKTGPRHTATRVRPMR